MSSPTAWAYSWEMPWHTRLRGKGLRTMAIRRPQEVWRVGSASHQELPRKTEARASLQCMTSVIISLHTKGHSGIYMLLMNYYNFNYGDFSGMPVLQGNSSGEPSGMAFFQPACCKLHIGVRRAQSENLMNSLRLCANRFFKNFSLMFF